MAPDINTLPVSPGQVRSPVSQQSSQSSSLAASRRASQQMPPLPTIPANLHSQRSSIATISDHVEVPLRHPRPMTAAEVYLECEKEQEAVVNRLTRELSALRAQAASVASNASHSSTSTSASLLPVDITDPNPTHQITGATHPTPSRRHRSSSSLSTRSIPNTAATTTTSVAGSSITNVSTQAHAGSITNVALGSVPQASASRAAGVPGNRSRGPSASASGTSTPARRSMEIARHSSSSTMSHRPSLSRDPSYISQLSHTAQAGSPYPPAIASPFPHPQTTDRAEVDSLRAENEHLRQRVRALERALRTRRRDSSNSDTARAEITRISSPEARHLHNPAGVAAWAAGDGGVGGVAGPRERSESQSTTASSRRGLPIDDDVRLGESAGSVGVGRGT